MISSLASALCHILGSEVAVKIGSKLFEQSLRMSTTEDLEPVRRRLEKLELEVEDLKRKKGYPFGPVKDYTTELGKNSLDVLVQPPSAPWRREGVERKFTQPGMLTREEIHYFHYISEYYTGEGEVVELGPWLGLSTHHLVDALSANSAFSNRRLSVFDDFIWRSDWMDAHYGHPEPPAHHSDFLPIFLKLAADIEDRIIVHKGKITDYDGNERLPVISWGGAPIEILVADCGRTIQANQSWFDLFSPSFIPNKTFVVMQDWRLHRERPRKWFNQTDSFTNQNPSLELIHEINDGGIATFLYRG